MTMKAQNVRTACSEGHARTDLLGAALGDIRGQAIEPDDCHRQSSEGEEGQQCGFESRTVGQFTHPFVHGFDFYGDGRIDVRNFLPDPGRQRLQRITKPQSRVEGSLNGPRTGNLGAPHRIAQWQRLHGAGFPGSAREVYQIVSTFALPKPSYPYRLDGCSPLWLLRSHISKVPGLQMYLHQDWEREYHLTPRGWLSGSSYVLGEIAAEIEPPTDRILTLVEQSRFVPGPSGAQSDWRYDWKSPEISTDDLYRLLATFGHRP
jgi:hypothetical protein